MGHRSRLKYEKLATRLKQSRLSQNSWARRLRISKAYLSQMVNGRRLYPSDEVRARLLQQLQAPFHEFFEVESETEKKAWPVSLMDWQRGRIRVRIDHLDPPTTVRPGGSMIHDTLQDIKLSWRTTWKTPEISLAIVLLMALGIGANSTIYSLVHASLLTPLPFPEPHNLVALWESDISSPGSKNSVSPAVFRDWQEQAISFTEIASYHSSPAVLSGSGEPEELQVGITSEEYFRVLGLKPLIGRFFTAEETQPGGNRSILISESFWRERLGSSPEATRQTLRIGGEPAQIIGVVPNSAGFNQHFDLWQPLIFDFDVEGSRGAHYLSVVARLAEKTVLTAARSEMDSIATRMAAQHPKNREEGVTMLPLLESVVGNARVSLLVLWGAVLMILGIACVNAANLILSRSAGRLREVAVRRALGASALRVWRQFIIESLQLSLFGGTLGVVIAFFSLPIVLHLIPTSHPRLQEATLNSGVLLFTLAVSLLTGLLFGLAPAFQSRKQDSWAQLREGSGAIQNSSTTRLRSLLLVAQISLAVVLVIGAGLLTQTLLRLSTVDPGFDASQVLTLRISLPSNRYSEERAAQFFSDLQARTANLPGVQRAGGTAFLPLGGAWTFGFDIVGQPEFPPGQKPNGVFRPVVGDYFQSLGIDLLQGRLFHAQDRTGTPLVVIVNQTLARRFFPDVDPLGQKLAIGYGSGEIQPREIVGVVSDIQQWGLGVNPYPGFYVPHQQVPFRGMTVVLKSEGSSLALAPLVKSRIWELDSELAPSSIETLDSRVAGQTANHRFRTFLVGSFAFLALLLALFGIYGVVSYWVVQRVPEIGLRMALGAGPGQVFNSILRKGIALAGIGLLLGAAVSLAAMQLISGVLDQVGATDPVTYLLVCLAMLSMALGACALPAYRATRIDPVEALKCE